MIKELFKPSNPNGSWVIGRNAVNEALTHCAKDIQNLLVCDQGDSTLQKIIGKARSMQVKIETVSRNKLQQIVGSDSHQGIACIVQHRLALDLDSLIEKTKGNTRSLIVALDEIEDPHNLGAILRACECFSVDAVLWSKNRGAKLSPVVSKTSAGASLLVPTTSVSNVADALRKLKAAGFWIVGCQRSTDSQNLNNFEFPAQSVLVLGSEGDGIRPILQNLLDYSVEIPQLGKLDSLNVSQAAAVMLYAARNIVASAK